MTIKLKIKNKQTELSVSEAEEIFNQLNQIFGKDNLPNPYIPNPVYPIQPLEPTYPTWPKFWYSDNTKLTSQEDLAWYSTGK